MDMNCILCKNKNNEEECTKAIHTDNWHCPSLSNIYYGTLINYFPFNLFEKIEKIRDKISEMNYRKLYEDFNEDFTENSNMKFIWGLKSIDDLSTVKPNLMSTNDIEIIYLKKEDKYMLSIETAYHFNSFEDEKAYLRSLLKAFTKYMKDNNLSIDKPLEPYGSMYQVFTDGMNINTKFDSIENAYRMFKILVNGYCK